MSEAKPNPAYVALERKPLVNLYAYCGHLMECYDSTQSDLTDEEVAAQKAYIKKCQEQFYGTSHHPLPRT